MFFDIVVARDRTTRLIGYDQRLPWRLPSDLKWFQRLTTGHVVLMGRRTWESLPKKPLPGRTNIVISSSMFETGDAAVARSLTVALSMVSPSSRCFVIGGEQLYREAIESPWCRTIYETVVDVDAEHSLSIPVGASAAYFPELPKDHYACVSESEPITDPETQLTYRRVEHRRKRPVLWWIDPSCYESDWLLNVCLSRIPHIPIVPPESHTVVPNAIIIANQLSHVRPLLDAYESSQTPYDLIHLSDEYLDDDTSCYYSPALQTVFRNYISPLHLRHPKVVHFGIGYRNQLDLPSPSAPPTPASPRPLVWSFAGYLKKSDRTLICNLFKVFQPYAIHETTGFNAGILSPTDYAAQLLQSTFVLCPVGNCSLDTFRLYEACEAGAIPVTLYTNVNQPYVRFLQHYWSILFQTKDLPFIIAHSWEENVQRLKFYLTHPDALRDLQIRCRRFWLHYKESLAHQFTQRLWYTNQTTTPSIAQA